MTTTEHEQQFPQPTFGHHAYSVDVTWFGDEGGYIARGHIPELRFIAACNHLARKELGLHNMVDESHPELEDLLTGVSHIWAVPSDPAEFGGEFEWAIQYGGITGDTPGAMPVTVWEP